MINFKQKFLRSVVRGAKGQGNIIENKLASGLIKAGETGTKVKNVVNRALIPGSPEIGSIMVDGVSKGVGAAIKHPTTMATVAANTGVTDGLGAISPAAAKFDSKLMERFPGWKKVGDKVGNFGSTKVGSILGDFGNNAFAMARGYSNKN